MTKEWIESLLDDMVESQWSKDIIKQEYERFSKLADTQEFKSIEELEPINQYSSRELDDKDNLDNDFNFQIENFSKSDYEDYLISKAVDNIREEYSFDVNDDYLEGLIKQHLEDEKEFLNMVVKEAIAEEDYFQDYIEKRISEKYYNDFPDYGDNDEDIYFVEYPVEKEIFDDLGDTSYMDQGIFEGANTDSLEEPFRYIYYEQTYFDEDLLDYEDEYDKSEEFIDIGNAPEDIRIDEPKEDNLDSLIEEKLFEEKYLDKVFVEIIKEEEYFDKIICEKLANDEKLNEKIDKLH